MDKLKELIKTRIKFLDLVKKIKYPYASKLSSALGVSTSCISYYSLRLEKNGYLKKRKINALKIKNKWFKNVVVFELTKKGEKLRKELKKLEPYCTAFSKIKKS